jgi:hypothetical protein
MQGHLSASQGRRILRLPPSQRNPNRFPTAPNATWAQFSPTPSPKRVRSGRFLPAAAYGASQGGHPCMFRVTQPVRSGRLFSRLEFPVR